MKNLLIVIFLVITSSVDAADWTYMTVDFVDNGNKGSVFYADSKSVDMTQYPFINVWVKHDIYMKGQKKNGQPFESNISRMRYGCLTSTAQILEGKSYDNSGSLTLDVPTQSSQLIIPDSVNDLIKTLTCDAYQEALKQFNKTKS